MIRKLFPYSNQNYRIADYYQTAYRRQDRRRLAKTNKCPPNASPSLLTELLYRNPPPLLRFDPLPPILTSSSDLACRISSRHGTTMRAGGRLGKRGSLDAYNYPFKQDTAGTLLFVIRTA